MKRWQSVIASLVVLVVVLSSGLALADSSGPGSNLIVKGAPVPANGTTIVRVYYPNLDAARKVFISFEAAMIETNYGEGYHLMAASPKDVARLAAAGLQVVADDEWVVAPQPQAESLQAEIDSIPGYPCYRTVEETFASAQSLAANYPNLATWNDVGDSWEKTAGLGGYDMLVLKLTNSAIAGPKPRLFVNSAFHAREYATAELVTRFGEYLVNNYGADPDVTWILDYHEVHLMLVANPDGRKMIETVSWRKNTNQNYCGPTSDSRGADPNRNFPFQWDCCGSSSDDECDLTYHGPYPASEPETQAVQNYMTAIFPDQRGPNLTDPAPDDATGIFLDIHSYSQLVLWPWGFTTDPAPNATQLQTLGRKFAYFNGYWPEQSIGLYPTDGTSDDHAYAELGVATYAFEVGTAFSESCGYFEDTLVPNDMPALLYAAKVVRTPYMTPAGPDALDLAVNNDPVPPGALVTLSATIDDTRYNNSNGAEPTQNVAAAEYYVDTPPWVTGATANAMTASDGSFNSTIENVEATVDTSDWSEGQHILFVRGKDAADNWGAFSAVFVTIASGSNMPPVAAFSYSCDDLACDLDASASYDLDGAIVGYDWRFGDQTTGSGMTTGHTYAAPGDYTVVLTVTDDGGATDTETQHVTVSARIFVYDIAMSGKRIGSNRTATAVVTIHDTSDNPVAGVTAYGAWSGDYNASVSGATLADGAVSFTSGRVKKTNATFTFTVDDMVKSGYTYDPALNNETSDTIVVP